MLGNTVTIPSIWSSEPYVARYLNIHSFFYKNFVSTATLRTKLFLVL